MEDDLDRYLAEYEEMTSGATKEVHKPVASMPREERDEFDYQLHKARVEAAEEKLNRELTEHQTNYYAVEEEKKRDKEHLVYNCIFLAVYACVLPFLLWLAKGGVSIYDEQLRLWGFGLLFAFVVVILLRHLVYLANSTFCYLVRCNRANANAYIENRKVKTYAKEEAYRLGCMQGIKERLRTLRSLDAKLEEQGRLTEEELSELTALSHVNFAKNPYNVEKVRLLDWIKYKLGDRSVWK